MSNRSQPGHSEQVGIYMVRERCEYHPRDICRENQYELDAPIQASVGEDYAESCWPVVVKVKQGISKGELVDMLERLTNKVRLGFFVDVAAVGPVEEDHLPGRTLRISVPRE